MKIDLKKYVSSFKSRVGNSMKRLGDKVTAFKNKRLGVKKNTPSTQIGNKVTHKPNVNIAPTNHGIDTKGRGGYKPDSPRKQELITLKAPSIPTAGTLTQVVRAAKIIPKKKDELMGIAKRQSSGISGKVEQYKSARAAIKNTQHEISAPTNQAVVKFGGTQNFGGYALLDTQNKQGEKNTKAKLIHSTDAEYQALMRKALKHSKAKDKDRRRMKSRQLKNDKKLKKQGIIEPNRIRARQNAIIEGKGNVTQKKGSEKMKNIASKAIKVGKAAHEINQLFTEQRNKQRAP